MTKYDLNFKLNAIKYYKSNDASINGTCNKFNIKSHANLSHWIRCYEHNGILGLKRKRNIDYDIEFKSSVVNYYKTHDISLSNLSIKYNINLTQSYSWIKNFDLYGLDGLKISRKRGRPPMKKVKNNKKIVPLSDSERNQYETEIMNLKNKIYNTEMEIDILKKQIALEMGVDIFPKNDDWKRKL